MKSTLLLVVVFLFSCKKNQDLAKKKPLKDTFEIVYEKHPNGLLAKTGAKVNNKRVGLWCSYDDNGKLESHQVYFHYDTTLSYRISFWETGDTLSYGYVKNEKSVGSWKVNYANYYLAEEGSYNSVGKKNGIWKEYREDRSLKKVTEYKNGKGKVVWDDKKDQPIP
jgi:antitoxin component YwqK of YwqJK toxin-antitoxin module